MCSRSPAQFYSNKMFDEDKLAALNEALAKLN